MQVAERLDEIDGQAACVTFAAPALLAAFERELGLSYPVYGDPDRGSYRAFGFGRASARRVWLDPRVWRTYAGLIARDRQRPTVRGDSLQLGGDIVLDAGGRVRWIYRSEGPEDRPPVDRLVDEVRAARSP